MCSSDTPPARVCREAALESVCTCLLIIMCMPCLSGCASSASKPHVNVHANGQENALQPIN
eukprot:1157588-Pelagomonas_calceolata.AAC.16